MAVQIADRITVDESVRFGKPVIRGTRVPVTVVVGQVAAGMAHEQIAEDYGICVEDVRAALEYAHRVLTQEDVGIPLAP